MKICTVLHQQNVKQGPHRWVEESRLKTDPQFYKVFRTADSPCPTTHLRGCQSHLTPSAKNMESSLHFSLHIHIRQIFILLPVNPKAVGLSCSYIYQAVPGLSTKRNICTKINVMSSVRHFANGKP